MPDRRKTLSRHIILDSIINRSPAMVFLTPIQEDWPVEFVTDNVEQILGYRKDEFISGRVSWPKIIHSEDLARLKAEVETFFEDGKTEFSQEYRLKTKSGEIRWMRDQNKVLFDETEAATHIQSIVLDIIEFKNAEHALLESEEKYRNLVENINDIFYVIDSNGIVTYISPPIKILLGYNPSDLIGHPFAKVVHPKDLPGMIDNFKKIKERNNKRGEYRVVTKSGDIRWILTSSRPLFSGDEYTGVQGLCTDITERKQMEEDLKNAQIDIERKSVYLEENVIALKVLLRHQDSEKIIMEKKIASTIQKLIIPYLEKARNITVNDQEKTYLDIIETNLANITKSFSKTFEDYLSLLTPTEIQIVNLLKVDKTTKEIAGLLYISETTVFFHRRNIRNKLGLKNKKKNLRSFLQSYQNNT